MFVYDSQRENRSFLTQTFLQLVILENGTLFSKVEGFNHLFVEVGEKILAVFRQSQVDISSWYLFVVGPHFGL